MKLSCRELMIVIMSLCGIGFLGALMLVDQGGFFHVLGEVHDVVFMAIYGVFAALKIVFFAGVAIGVSGAIVIGYREWGVVRPGKYGPAQAIKRRGKDPYELQQPMSMDSEKLKQQMIVTIREMAKAQGALDKVIEANPTQKQLEAPRTHRLPEMVRYEEIKSEIPPGEALVGIDERGVQTRRKGIKSLIWIVGSSGSGKTNSGGLRVDEDYMWGHWFILIDPHWFKEDSMYNAIRQYEDRFLLPVAYEAEQIIEALDSFMAEFERRKAGNAWEFPITLIIDEVGSLTADKPETPQEKEMIEKIKKVARLCGQETRNFEMGGLFLSQDAAGLAWLRKRAIMVLAHQLLMMSERLLATNENAEVSREMDTWPIGRTLVYGIGFTEGQRVMQQPVRPRMVVEGSVVRNPQTFSIQSDMGSGVLSVSSSGRNTGPLGGKPLDSMDCTFSGDIARLKKVREKLREKATQQDIVCEVWQVQPSTRAFHAAVAEYREMLAYIVSGGL